MSKYKSAPITPANEQTSVVMHGTAITGHYEWPFTFNIPAEVQIKGQWDKKTTTHRVPHTFVEKNGGHMFIQYDIIAHIRRTTFRVDSKFVFRSYTYVECINVRNRLRSVFGFTPLIVPSPPSPLRQLAYQEASPLLGPSADPAGWKLLSPFQFDGMLFGARPTQVKCTLAIAEPVGHFPHFITFIRSHTRLACFHPWLSGTTLFNARNTGHASARSLRSTSSCY
jgi:hypothetical protein